MSTVVMHNVVSVDGYIADYVRPTWNSIGSMVIGRHLFDMTNGWEGTPPAGEHVVVVSYRPKPDGWHPEASYHFVDDVGWCSAPASGTSGRSTASTCWRTPTWSSAATGSCTCTTGFRH